jgi:hypothetical protein
MKKNKIAIIGIAFVLVMSSGCKQITSDDDMTVTGTVRSVGSVPVNNLVLDADDGTQYAVASVYTKYTGYTLTVTGCIDGDTMYGDFLDIHDIDDIVE